MLKHKKNSWRMKRLRKIAHFFSSQPLRILLFVPAFVVVGAVIMLFLSRADSAPAKFQLFTPSWRGLGSEGLNAAVNFPETFSLNDQYNPTGIHTANPNAKSYNYTLGPYVTAILVPCSIMPSENQNASKCGEPLAAGESGQPGQKHTSGPFSGKFISLPLSALAKDKPAGDSTGKAVYANGFTNNFLIVPDDPAWTSYVKNVQAPGDLKYNGDASNLYDGIITDSMGDAPTSDPAGYLNNVPINPNTGVKYTKSQWLTAEKATITAKRQGIGSTKTLIMNGLANGNDYWATPEADGTKSLLGTDSSNKTVDGAMAESIFRSAGSNLDSWPATTSWMNDIRMIEDVEVRGINGYWWSKCWSGRTGDTPNQQNVTCSKDDAIDGDASLTTVQKEEKKATLMKQWRRFAMGSYLLAAGSHSYFNWDTDKSSPADTQAAAEYFTDYDKAKALGNSTSTRVQVSGNLYKRTFDRGILVVNSSKRDPAQPATGTIAFTLPSGKAYTNLDGATVSGTVNLNADTSEIFLEDVNNGGANLSVTLGSSRAILPNMFGFNGEAIDGATQHWVNDGFKTAVGTLNPGVIRVGGGTTANYWDWESGKFLAGFDFAAGSPALTLNDWAGVINSTGAKPLFDLNMITDTLTAEQRTAKRGQNLAADGLDDLARFRLANQLRMLCTAQFNSNASLRMDVKYVELGNEIYRPIGENLPTFPDNYPAGKENTAGYPSQGGENYAKASNAWAKAIKNYKCPEDTSANTKSFTDVKIAAVGLLGTYITDANSAVMKRWQSWKDLAIPEPATTTESQRKHFYFNAANGLDSITYHLYWGIPNAPDSDINSAALINQALTQYKTRMKPDISRLPSNASAWATEWNFNDIDTAEASLSDTWTHGLSMAAVALEQLNEPKLQISTSHSLIGRSAAAKTKTFFAVLPTATTNVYNVSTYGKAMGLLGEAARGSSSVQTLSFSSNPNLVGTTQPSLAGWVFLKSNGSKKVVFLNLGKDLQKVNPASELGAGDFKTVSGTYNTPAANLQTSVGTFTAGGEVTLKPYSITVLTIGASSTTVTTTITSPTTSSTYNLGSSVPFSATATVSPTTSPLSEIKLTLDSSPTSLKTCTTAPITPCTFSWNSTGATSGTHTLHAIAKSGTLSSPTVDRTFTIDTPPTASITSPAASPPSVSGIVAISATASDDHQVSKVEYYVGSILKQTTNNATASYSGIYNWDTNTSDYPNGTYELKIKAYDNAPTPNVVIATVRVAVNNPPTVITTIAAPAETTLGSGTSAAVSGHTVNLFAKATVTPIPNTIDQIKLEMDGTVLKTCTKTSTVSATPCTFSWDSVTVPNGTHVFKAIASSGTIVKVAIRNIPVDNDLTPPTVSITSPTAGATVSGITTVQATAGDNVAVSRVEFYVDGILINTSTASPYSFEWNTACLGDGNHILTAKAFDAIQSKTSDPVTLTANGTTTPGCDAEAPTVSISAPLDGTTVSGTTTIYTNVSDNVGVASVDLYIDGSLYTTDIAGSFVFNWDTIDATQPYANGPHTLYVIAHDTATPTQNQSISSSITLIVNNPETPKPAKLGDFNNDQKVDGYDLSIMFEQAHWLQVWPEGDIFKEPLLNPTDTYQALVNVYDLSVLISREHWEGQ